VYNVLYTSTRAAKEAGIRRGDLLILDATDANSISVLRVKPNQRGGLAVDKRITYNRISSRAAKNETVYMDSIYTIGNSKIGYMCYLQYDSPEDFNETINTFANTGITDMILDLRYNPGGLVNTCKKLCNLIVSTEAYGRVFQQQSFNDILSADYLNRTGNERTFTYYSAPAEGATLGLKYEYLNLKRVFILTSKGTASASESTIICLKPYINVITIGEQTTGKGVGMWTLSSSNYRYALVPITFRYYNAADETVPDEGLTPDYYIPDGYSTRKSELGDVNEPLLNHALQLICPNSFVAQPQKRSNNGSNNDIYLTPIGEPSYLQEFKQKQYQYEN
jgi:C-terminal processing protease CtpA/Prc